MYYYCFHASIDIENKEFDICKLWSKQKPFGNKLYADDDNDGGEMNGKISLVIFNKIIGHR